MMLGESYEKGPWMACVVELGGSTRLSHPGGGEGGKRESVT